MASPFFLEVSQIRKHFPGVLALGGVSVGMRAGEVLAVVGENGAGKSTLMKILAGVYKPDGGEILLEGKPVHFQGVAGGLSAGDHALPPGNKPPGKPRGSRQPPFWYGASLGEPVVVLPSSPRYSP